LAFCKIINEEDAVFIQKNWRRDIFKRNFALGIFWYGWAAMPPLHWMLLCLGS
jgi:hypothetical protein